MIQIYDDKYKQEVIDLILHIQNVEYGVGISIEDQTDLLDINRNYIECGGCFWVALNEEGKVVGSIGVQIKTKEIAVLKKLFVYKEYRGKEIGIGQKLYDLVIDFAKSKNISTIFLDSPDKTKRAHNFYRKSGFVEIGKEELPIAYDYPDRNSLIFRLDLI
ncbi:GNAT family N-acetyltransferase [Clostridium sp. MB40-C1]|uniref:GNAT family N-acetyltransferase n=1 Tax=Clostridium sp. MB40-C1 TaxID=3070996 RepID=UPI0027DEDECC|nr:GNAT family N-acetyltransferase [Clostridium sp. MB40-C1]WMJ80223.1 GNAT family N-acetyltransferase [Clostridium sp. MB40-C1]